MIVSERGIMLADIINKLDEIAAYADANADADPSHEAVATWRSHARNVREVRDMILTNFANG